MAQLKDTLIQGSARVTDTLYANTINTNELTAEILETPILKAKEIIPGPPNTNDTVDVTGGINYYHTDGTIQNHIGFMTNATTTSAGIGIYSTGVITLRPKTTISSGKFTYNKGIKINDTEITPAAATGTGAISLGTSSLRWNGVYSSTGNFSETITAERLSTNIFLDFRCSDGPSYIMLPDSKDLIINNGSTNGAAYANLAIGKTGITNAYGGSLGSSAYPWGSLYSKGPSYIYSGNSQWCLDTYIYNKSKNQVAEIYYNSGNADNVTTGRFSFRQFSPKATPDTATSGFHETFYLPSVTNARTNNAEYAIITTKNLSSITTVGTISSGTWNGTKIGIAYGGTGLATTDPHKILIGPSSGTAAAAPTWRILDSADVPTLSITDKTSGTLTVARGGTGVTSFTNDCAVVSTGTTQTLVSRGLKITGGINENVVITSYGSGKTLTVESSDTLILNKPAGSSISFRSNGTIIGQFNRNGSLQIGNETNATQTDYKLYVRDGNFGLTGKIAFNTNITTENASVQYINSGLFYRGTIITGTGVAAGGNGTNGYTGARWVFNLGIDVPTNGDRITIKVPVASHDYGTYISTDNGTTFRPVGINGSTTRLTGQFPANSIVTLVYDSTGTINSLFPPTTGATSRANSNTTTIPGAGCWRLVNYYDSGNDGLWYVRYYNLKAQTAIKAVHIIGGTDNGYNHVDSGTAFDIRYPLLYAGSAISAGSAGSNNFLFHYAINIKNSSETNISSFTAYKPVYIKGTISGMMFTPISGGNPYVQAVTEAEDGYIYYYIGRAYASNAITFDATARAMFWYKNGAVTIYNALNAIYTKNTSGTLEWVSGAVANEYLLTKNAIAYWNGAYAGTSSNLAYCNKGAFGTIVTKSTSDYVALDSNNNATISGTFLASNTSSEPQIKVSSGAGNIYLYSQTSSTGNRGLYGYNAAGTGAHLLIVDQNNNITIQQTLILSKTQDASGTADSGPALIVGTRSGEHLEIDGNEIMAKASGTTTGSLYLNNDGGATIFGGIIQVKGRIVGITTNATKGTTPTANSGGYIPFGEVGYAGTDAKNRIGMLYSYVDTANTAHTALYAYKNVKDSTVNTFFAVSITNASTPVKRTHTDALIYGAVWNDYAEYRASTAKEPGRVLVEDTDGVMKIAQSRLLPGCRVYSDTFGMAIGETEKDNTPIAVSGRVLVYPYRDRKEYHLGDAVCSAPNGTVDIMSREEIMTYPERIIGTVSEIPDYEEWECGYCYETEPEQQPIKSAIKVKGRIWIYVR